jgi:hypothetical protein
LQVLIEDDQSNLARVNNITTELVTTHTVDFLLAPYV